MNDTTQLGVSTEDEDVETVVTPAADAKNDAPKSERELAIERIAEQRNRRFEEDEGVKIGAADPEPKDEAKPAALDAATQIGKQLETGQILLDDAMLANAVVRQKVDGKEELVPAEKIFRAYQKGAAADLRLAEATRMQKEAADALAAAQKQLADASTARERKDAVAAVEAASDLVGKRKELLSAMYSGDEEKAGQLLTDFVGASIEAALAGRGNATQPNVDEVVAQAVQKAIPALKSQLSVESALTTLERDYPEIWADADFAMIADRHVNEFVAQGKTQAQAILDAAEVVGQKFKLGKFAAPQPQSQPTARDEKQARKQALDEPAAAAARAPSNEPPQQTPSQVIAEMARARQVA